MRCSKKELYHLYITKDRSVDFISKLMNVDVKTIYRWLKYYDISLKNERKRNKKPIPYNKEQLQSMYNRYSLEECCEKTNVSIGTFYKWLDNFGICHNKKEYKKFIKESIKQNLSKDLILKEYYDENKSLITICKKYNIRFEELKEIMKENNISVKDHKHDIDKDDFYQYYVIEKHSQKETCDHFNIPYSFLRKYIVQNNMKQTKIASKRNLYKGSYEDFYKYYVTESHTLEDTAEYFGIGYYTAQNYAIKYGMNRSVEQRLNNMYETNQKTIDAKTKFGTEEFKKWHAEHKPEIMEKVKKTCQEKYHANSFVESEEAKNIWKMGTSRTETNIYNKLLTKYSEVKRWYNSDSRYPFECDFYIPLEDLFIEYQGFRTHGKEPFDECNPKHLKKVEQMLENPDYYKDSLYIWTQRDVLKRETAKKNGLNYLEFFSEKEFNKWFEKNLDK